MSVRSLVMIGSVAGALTAIAGAFAVFGVPVPRPAWAAELKQVEQKILEIDNIITSEQLDETTLRLYRNIREQQIYINRGEDIPDFLLSERSTLEGRQRVLQLRLDNILESSND